jgi:hypothetical protein
MLRSIGEPGEIDFEGIEFAMADERGRRVMCLVLYGVLSYLDRAPNPRSAKSLESFNRHRSKIERWVIERFTQIRFNSIRIEMAFHVRSSVRLVDDDCEVSPRMADVARRSSVCSQP